jgi:hypothetical protein
MCEVKSAEEDLVVRRGRFRGRARRREGPFSAEVAVGAGGLPEAVELSVATRRVGVIVKHVSND